MLAAALLAAPALAAPIPAPPPLPPIPTVEVAPGVRLPMVTMGGVNATDYPTYPDYTNYSLWLEVGGRGFDSAWEYRTQRGIGEAIRASGLPRHEIFVTTKMCALPPCAASLRG